MSKVSVFKFNINGGEQTLTNANQIITDYLKINGFFYSNEKLCYVKQINKNTLHAFEFQIGGNQLVIRAYTIDCRYNSKQYIHSSLIYGIGGPQYYNNLKNVLFKKLKENNINLVSTGAEKTNDGSKSALSITIKMILIYVVVMILFLLITWKIFGMI